MSVVVCSIGGDDVVADERGEVNILLSDGMVVNEQRLPGAESSLWTDFVPLQHNYCSYCQFLALIKLLVLSYHFCEEKCSSRYLLINMNP